jgi:dipeptidyl aminopeptidase/acylaminoacyl peptidase
MNTIHVRSTLDGSLQPSLFFRPQTEAPVPLVVGLHTWSYGRSNQLENYLPLCRKYGWALLLPEFRGPNLASNPNRHDACGSLKARRDILDAVEHVSRTSSIDRGNIFLLGCSGGGHAALLVAEDAPDVFRAVDVWCPVSDLAAWHAHLTETRQHYVHDMEACLGGGPAELPGEYALRSPSEHVAALKRVPVSVHHGRHDDVVPYRHSVEFVRKLEAAGAHDVYFEVFDGEHEQFPSHSFDWFARLAGARPLEDGGDAAVRITG